MSAVALNTVYTVVAGDSLSKLAQRFYGDVHAYTRIAERNNLDPQSILLIGQKLVIPAATDPVEEVQVTAQHLPATLPRGGALIDPATGIETVTTTAYVWWKDWRWYAAGGGVALLLFLLSRHRRN